jgi:transcription initiation factor IIE alpha subunit
MPRQTANAATGIKGVRIGKQVAAEAEHLQLCPDCGQALDLRDHGEVMHHIQPGHEPIRDN